MSRDLRHVRLAPCSGLAIHAAIAIMFLLPCVLDNRVQAQTARETRIDKNLDERRKALLDLEKRKEGPAKPSEPRLPYAQLKQDFEELQVINNHLTLAVSESRSLDYERIRDDVVEIRKRSRRLQANLSLPEPGKTERLKKDEDASTPEAAFKSSLAELRALIRSFVENPLFQHVNVMNVGYSMRASRDLEDIIKLSDQIEKRAEALNKAGGKNL